MTLIYVALLVNKVEAGLGSHKGWDGVGYNGTKTGVSLGLLPKCRPPLFLLQKPALGKQSWPPLCSRGPFSQVCHKENSMALSTPSRPALIPILPTYEVLPCQLLLWTAGGTMVSPSLPPLTSLLFGSPVPLRSALTPPSPPPTLPQSEFFPFYLNL